MSEIKYDSLAIESAEPRAVSHSVFDLFWDF